jgi:hypothetical protein
LATKLRRIEAKLFSRTISERPSSNLVRFIGGKGSLSIKTPTATKLNQKPGCIKAQGSHVNTTAQAVSQTSAPCQRRADKRSKTTSDCLHVLGAALHNLGSVSAAFPLQRLVAVTGVSGSGKSTLARDVLLANVHTVVSLRSTQAGRKAHDAGKLPVWQGCVGLAGYESIERVLEVDQTPIGKTPRSCPATTLGFGTPYASCLLKPWKPKRGVMPLGASASTPAKAVAQDAKAKGCERLK